MLEKGPSFGGGLSPRARSDIEAIKHRGFETLVKGLRAKPFSEDDPRRLQAMGGLWRGLREMDTVSVDELSTRMGIPAIDLVAFETGLLNPNDYKDGFIDELGQALNVPPHLMEFHRSIFGPQADQRRPLT